MTTALSSQLDALLSGFGVVRSNDYDVAERVVQDELDRIMIPASFDSLRHGEMVLHADPQSAALLRYDLDQLRSRLEVALPGLVTKITIKTRRFTSQALSPPDGQVK